MIKRTEIENDRLNSGTLFIVSAMGFVYNRGE